MCDALEAVAETVCKIVRRVDLPLLSRSNVRRLILGDTVGCEIPHLGIVVLNVLFHSKKRSLRLILAVSHVSELCKVRVDVLVSMAAAEPWAFLAVLAAALQLDL